jgi:hypothetical protein
MLVTEVEPDYKRNHFQCGLGFQSRTLIKAEVDAKSSANTINYDLASTKVEILDDTKVNRSFDYIYSVY